MDYEYIEGEIAGNKLLYLKNEKQIFCLKTTIKNTKYFDCRIKYCPAKFRIIQDICKRKNEHSHYDDQYFQYIKFKRNLRSQAASEKIRYKNEQSLKPDPKRLSTRNSLTRKSIEKFDESRNLNELDETTTVLGSPMTRRFSRSRRSIEKFDESRDLLEIEEFQELPLIKKRKFLKIISFQLKKIILRFLFVLQSIRNCVLYARMVQRHIF